jgi:hypothetical protein
MKGMPRRLAIAVGSLAFAGCLFDPLTNHPVSVPAWYADNTARYIRTATGSPPDTAYGWDLKVAAGMATWRECDSPDECGHIERARQADDVLAIDAAGRGRLGDGTEVDVVKLSLAPGRKYVVPAVRWVR